MPSSDFAKRQSKKPRKGAKKEAKLGQIVTPTPEPEVVRKPRKPPEEEEE
ncbi:MAG: hypothetical protein Q8O40_17245 [Chloroflexota bacterium]|nr:hypothetical protein [Chloroflexota bacterium]